jgi:hypothetical protein
MVALSLCTFIDLSPVQSGSGQQNDEIDSVGVTIQPSKLQQEEADACATDWEIARTINIQILRRI